MSEPTPVTPDEQTIEQLKRFYNVQTLEELVLAQNRHIEKLQQKLPPGSIHAVQQVREG